MPGLSPFVSGNGAAVARARWQRVLLRLCGKFLLAASLLSAFSIAFAAQASTSNSWTAEGWAALAKLPDWQGLWALSVEQLQQHPPPEPLLTPVFAARRAAYLAAQRRGQNIEWPMANCLPPAMPEIMTLPYPIEFLFTPGKVTIAIEAFGQMRRIYTDGRDHPRDPDSLWYGHSIGKWEDQTLLIDTTDFDPSSTLSASSLSPRGIYHSDRMHISERISLVAPDRLRIVTTVTDPNALAKPWTFSWDYQRHRDWDIREYICEQNNRNSVDEQGRPHVRLEKSHQ
jgi:hypothetical protein